MASHVKYRHDDIKGLGEQHHSDASLEQKTEEQACIEIVHIVPVYHHCYQLINQHETDNHSRYGDYHILRQRFYHVENAGVPCTRRGGNLARNRANLVIDICKYPIK